MRESLLWFSSNLTGSPKVDKIMFALSIQMFTTDLRGGCAYWCIITSGSSEGGLGSEG